MNQIKLTLQRTRVIVDEALVFSTPEQLELWSVQIYGSSWGELDCHQQGVVADHIATLYWREQPALATTEVYGRVVATELQEF